MLASAALPSPSLLPNPAVTLPGEAPVAVEGADFGAFLAQSANQATSQMPVLTDTAAISTAITTSVEAATAPAMTGNILPPSLPEAAMPETPVPEEAQPAQPQPAAPLPPAMPVRTRVAAPRVEGAKDAPVEGEQAEPAEMTGMAETLATVTLAVPTLPIKTDVPQKTLPALPVQSGAVAVDHANVDSSEPESTNAGSRAAQVILPEAAAIVAPLRKGIERHVASDAKAAPLPQAPQLSAATTPIQPDRPAPAPITQVRLEVTMPEALRSPRAESPRLTQHTAEKVEAELSMLPQAPAQTASAATLSPVAPPTAPTAAMERPRDFTALVERLAAAREAVQPQAVSISLPHVDFGRVQLRFRHDDGALAVSMASSDPDFARIAAQLAPPVLPVADARSLSDSNAQPQTRQDSARTDNPGQGAATQQHANPRGQGHERRGDGAAEHRLNPHQTRAAQQERRAGRGGIFA